MEKSTAFIIALVIICVTVLGVAGEYFSYQSSLRASQNAQQPVATPTSSPAITSGSSENSIASFSFANPMAIGTIDAKNHAVAITVPPDTDVTKLVPTIQISQNATISPASLAPQDFINPVIYTVTAQNGAQQKYTVTVNVASILKSAGKFITSFKLAALKPAVDGYIDNDNFTVTAVVPDGTDLTNLTPTITVSDGATISPNSGNSQNFTNPVNYTVTDIYGTTQIYTITVVTESNSG